MEYSFVEDPELRDKLIKARKNGKKILEKKIIDSDLTTEEDVKVSNNLKGKKILSPNKKFENLSEIDLQIIEYSKKI